VGLPRGAGVAVVIREGKKVRFTTKTRRHEEESGGVRKSEEILESYKFFIKI
jgi:hypothetical protein